MWTIDHTVSGSTNKFTVTTEEKITVNFPPGVRVKAYVNEVRTPVDMLNVKPGDIVYFKLKNTTTEPKTVTVEYYGTMSTLELAAHSAASSTYEEDIMNPTDTLNLFAGTGMGGNQGGAMGAGLGAGLVGGLLGTALFGRNGLNGLNGSDGIVGAPATLQGVESVVNNSAIMSQLADIKASVPLAEGQVQLALAQAQMNLSNGQAASTGSIIGSISAFESSVMNNLNMQTQMNQKGFSDNATVTVAQGTANLLATKDAALQAERNSWALNQVIVADGDRTRALITAQYEATLNRQLGDANAEIIALRSRSALDAATNGITLTNTNNINQMQQQAQQQAQYGQLSNMIWGLGQSIRSTNEAINIGSGALSASPANTNTNVR
jgi:hypothetical protein